MDKILSAQPTGNLTADKLILASGSPRRRQLLELAGYSFTVVSADVDETSPPGVPVAQVPELLARKKATAVAHRYPGAVIIAADTVVLLDEEILGKPKDAEDAKAMLARLSGRTHRVVTGVCIQNGASEECFSTVTEVSFRSLAPADIDYYVTRFKPFDKAGSYAIQEWIGLIGIERIDGDYYNVMGLPIGEVVPRLSRLSGGR
jgi:septum formation protein